MIWKPEVVSQEKVLKIGTMVMIECYQNLSQNQMLELFPKLKWNQKLKVMTQSLMSLMLQKKTENN